jgi:hypothetical protein
MALLIICLKQFIVTLSIQSSLTLQSAGLKSIPQLLMTLYINFADILCYIQIKKTQPIIYKWKKNYAILHILEIHIAY